MEAIDAMFRDGSDFPVDDISYKIHVRKLGEFLMPTKELVVSDGLAGTFFKCDQKMPSSVGCLFLSIGCRSDGDEGILAALIQFRDCTIERIVPATFARRDYIECESLGSLICDSACTAQWDGAAHSIRDALSSNYKHTRTWAAGTWNGGTYILVDSGFGTGRRTAYHCSDGSGRIVAVLFDFLGTLEEI